MLIFHGNWHNEKTTTHYACRRREWSFAILDDYIMVATKREIMLNLPTQHHLCILQRLIIQQPVQFCPLCRGVAVLVLNGDAVDGNSRAVDEPGFYPVGVHVVAAGKQVVHKKTSMFFPFASFAVESFGCPFADL